MVDARYFAPPRANAWVAVPAAVAAATFLATGLFCALAPWLVFHSQDPDLYSAWRDAAPVLFAAAIVTANVWVWSAVRPRLYLRAAREGRAPRTIGPKVGMLVGSLFAAAILAVVVGVIWFTTVQWFTF